MPQTRGDSTRGSRSAWRPLMKACTDTGALTAPALSTTKPAGYVFGTSDMRLARFAFGGTAAAGLTIAYQVIGWSRYRRPEIAKGTFWLPRILAEGTITLGAQTLTAAGADVDVLAAFIADTITETRGWGGTAVNSPADDTIAFLEVATGGCELIELEIDLGTAATAWAMYRLGDGVW